MKKLIALVLRVCCVFAFASCSSGISGDDAKSHINGFLEKVESGDYEAAEEFLHPERPANLKTFFENVSMQKNVDFSDINIEKYTGFKSVLYDGSVDGPTYTLTMDISVSGKNGWLEIEIVRNDNGFGIYNLDINLD